MEILTANKAKTHFGEMLMKVQREPVQIDKNGKPIAVVVSIEDYEAAENIKLQVLQDRFKQINEDIKNGLLVDDADEFFEKLIAGGFDE
ncbi:MAG: type II toxin-antitoxin system prevent-host-death family antitoxin [Proteobacteria bacterium]|nr:type II toxin-antitoxin system prevent-host-death family antitoxin [Pseudomonadota bacterium]